MSINCVIVVVITLSSAYLGVDISAKFTPEDFKCIIQSGHGDFIIERAWRSYGTLDPNIIDNLGNAWNAGFNYVDVYMFPCIPCGNPQKQVDDMLSGIHDARFQIIWLDIEVYQWNADIEINRQFIRGLVNELKASEMKFGFYSDATSWKKIVGDWTEMADEMLWYAQWDNSPSFGGWTKPYMKQYRRDQKLCNTDVNFDFY